jgi:hypothetical protein
LSTSHPGGTLSWASGV